MIIKVERSGGFAGLLISNEMDAKDLPSTLRKKIKKILATNEASSLPLKPNLRGAADHYTYKISIHDGTNLRIIVCDQFNIQEDLKSLVKHFETKSKRK